MIEAPIPQDIFKVKGKVAGTNFELRQFVSLFVSAFIAFFVYFLWVKNLYLTNQLKILIIVLCISPVLAFGFIRPFDEPLEKVIMDYLLDNFLTPAHKYKEEHYPELEAFEKYRSFAKVDKHGKQKIKIKPSSKYKAIK